MALENAPIVIQKGPTGFLIDGENMLVVEDGQIFKDGQYMGRLFDDGYLRSTDGSLGKLGETLAIETFRLCSSEELTRRE